MNDRVIGIIGGMGPEATADFYMKIVKGTKVKRDQDHFHVIIDSNAKIPDRTKAILHGGESPVPEIIKAAKRLGQMGVEVACIPCLTSHYYIKELQASVDYEILNIFEELAKYIQKEYPEVKKVGVLATSGTVQMGLFNQYLTENTIIYPKKHVQEEKVMEAIYGEKGIKSGNLEGKPVGYLIEASESLADDGAELLILGCTEVGLALKQQHVSLPVIDPLDVVVKALTK